MELLDDFFFSFNFFLNFSVVNMLLLWFKKENYFKTLSREFPGSPEVKPSPSRAGGSGWTPGQRAVPHASWPKNQNIKQKQHCNKFNKDFKNCPHLKKKSLRKHCLTQDP